LQNFVKNILGEPNIVNSSSVNIDLTANEKKIYDLIVNQCNLQDLILQT
jgi:hypothetical protein